MNFYRFKYKNFEDLVEVFGGFLIDCNKVRFVIIYIIWLCFVCMVVNVCYVLFVLLGKILIVYICSFIVC